jgi:hypothetical protein
MYAKRNTRVEAGVGATGAGAVSKLYPEMEPEPHKKDAVPHTGDNYNRNYIN